ncbi:MAG: tRNA 2-thiouridine(34) synthase MnmA [Candidatus Aureabacteria bacterium]|nr:tRNA 2-thiouridine(34) synthase MnmA [Candidatus Auribacterota bacterium]
MDSDNDIPVFVALSGGVDSSVAAFLLKKRFKNLSGISHLHWPESRCCSKEFLNNCAEFCRELSIPYLVVHCQIAFKKQVVDPFVSGYIEGIALNPCVICNEKIRFSHMIEKYHQMQGLPMPEKYYLATGHYARINKKEDRYYLLRGKDRKKDQSYMLYRLSQEELSHCLFPLGKHTKSEVKKWAIKWGISSAQHKESQDICFTMGSYQDFITSHLHSPIRPGDFLDESGKKLGSHKGIVFYTQGQRKGLGLSGGPWYVKQIDPNKNIIILSRQKKALLKKRFIIKDTHWIYPEIPEGFPCTVETRLRSKEKNCILNRKKEKEWTVEMAEPSYDVCPGQSAVFYEGDYVVGGGIIQE